MKIFPFSAWFIFIFLKKSYLKAQGLLNFEGRELFFYYIIQTII